MWGKSLLNFCRILYADLMHVYFKYDPVCSVRPSLLQWPIGHNILKIEKNLKQVLHANTWVSVSQKAATIGRWPIAIDIAGMG